jgi:hypothetical protein
VNEDLFFQVINWLAFGIIGYFTVGGFVLGGLLLRWAVLERGWQYLGDSLRWRAIPGLWTTWPVALAVVLHSMWLSWKVRRITKRLERRYGKD